VRFTTTVPSPPHAAPEFFTRAGLTRLAQACERAGFDGLGVTDHPAPTHRWLTAGGHDALDPFAALAFVGAVTERLRLIPNIVVLPYRNPFLVAKSVATLDALTEGRFTLAVGAGYLKGEYQALGVDFDERNARFDEALDVLRGVWSTDDFAYQGEHFTARGQTANPKPGPVPIWIGGNSALSRRRVATSADGWVPFRAPRVLAQTAKTPPLETADDFAAMVADLRGLVEAEGRDPDSIDIAFQATEGGSPGANDFQPAAYLDSLGWLAELGMTWASVHVPGDSVDRAVEVIEQVGREVVTPLR